MASRAGGGPLADHKPLASAIERASGPRVPALLFAVFAALSAALLLGLGSRLTFLLDDWVFLIYRTGFDAEAILSPHNEHIVAIPILVYKGLLEAVGMDSALPFRAVSIALFITSATLLFVYLRSRLGGWLALAAAASVLFLGAAWEDLLWPFQLGYFGSMSCGLGALLALERRTRRADLVACALLVLALGFSTLGIPFVVAVTVAIVLGPVSSWSGRAFIVAVPTLLFAIWWLGWGRDAETSISLANIATAPLFVIDGFASTISSLLGLATPRDEIAIEVLAWGKPLLAAAVVLAGWRLWVLGRVPRGLIVVVALALCFWLLAGINEKPGRTATASRYVYVGAFFFWLIVAELLRGVRVPGRALVAVFALTALAVASNLSFLHQSYLSYRSTSELSRADLGAIEIARNSVDPAFRLDEAIAQTAYVGVEAGPYLAAVDEFGSPAYTPDELAAAPEHARFAADVVLSRALGITFTPARQPGPATGPAPVVKEDEGDAVAGGNLDAEVRGSCLLLGRSPRKQPWVVELPPGGAEVRNGGPAPAQAKLRRFAEASFPVEAGEVGPGRIAVLDIPRDRSTAPWDLELRSRGPLAVCGRSEAEA